MREASNEYHNVCFCGEMRKISTTFGGEKYGLSIGIKGMFSADYLKQIKQVEIITCQYNQDSCTPE